MSELGGKCVYLVYISQASVNTNNPAYQINWLNLITREDTKTTQAQEYISHDSIKVSLCLFYDVIIVSYCFVYTINSEALQHNYSLS